VVVFSEECRKNTTIPETVAEGRERLLFAFLANPIAGAITLLVGSLIPGYILYMMVSAKGSMVFSPEYKAIILKTPHVKYKTSLIVKIFLAILLLVIGLAGVGAIMSSLQPR